MARSRNNTSEGDAADALKEFQQELTVDPTNANAAYELAEAERNSGRLDEAKNFFEIALKFHPDFEEAHLGLAAVLTSLQQPAQALPHIQQALTLNKQNEVSWYRLSQVQGMLGNTAERQKAFAEFQRLRNEKSNREEAGKQLASPDEVTKQQVGPNDAKP